MSDKNTGKQPEVLKDDDLGLVQGGFAALKPAELVNQKRPQSSGFFRPEVDDEVIV